MTQINDLKIARSEIGKCRIENIVIPARVVSSRDVHVRPIVGNDQAISLHRAEDLLYFGRKLREVAARCGFVVSGLSHRSGGSSGAGDEGGFEEFAAFHRFVLDVTTGGRFKAR